MHTVRLEKSIAEFNEQQYGENWDSAHAISMSEYYSLVYWKLRRILQEARI